MDHDRVIARDTQHSEAHDEKARDRAAAKSERQRLVEPDPGSLRGAHVGANRDIHSDIAGRPRQDRTERESPSGRPSETRNEADHQEQDYADDAEGGVLAVQVGHGARLNSLRDLAHAVVASRLLQDPGYLPAAVGERRRPADEGYPETSAHKFLP